MTSATSVTIVCSPRPRVGRTLLARLLLEFYLANGREAAGFDLNPENDLAACLPERASTAAVGEIKGQMALFDRLIDQDGFAKVVDLGPNAFGSFFAVANDIGFVTEALRRGITPVILFMISPDKASAEAYAGLQRKWPRVSLVPVHNEINGRAQHRDLFPVDGVNSAPLHLAAATPGIRRYLERRPFALSGISGDALLEIPLDVQMELQRWLRRVFLEFRELELRVLKASLQSSLQNQ